MTAFIVQVISWLAAALAGWFISQLEISWWLSNLLWGPKLCLDVKQEDGSVINVPVDDEEGQPPGRHAQYFRVEVRNGKWRQATGVIGLLTDIRKFDPGTQTYVRIGYRDTLPLGWSYRSSEPIALSYDMRQFLDVIRVIRAGENGQVIGSPHLALSFMPNTYREILSTGGKYLFRIVLQADQHVQEEIGMIFEWDGNPNLQSITVRPRFSRGNDAD